MKTGILLINLGTPDSSSVAHVRKFLREFLMDPLVVDIPFLPRWLLVNLIIVPFRGPKSASEYQRLWTDKGSPLKVHSEELLDKLLVKFHGNFDLALAMRYQNPDIRSALEKLKQSDCEQLVILPLFPQYAEATTLSVLNRVKTDLSDMDWSVNTKIIESFATDDGFIDALVAQASSMDITDVDHTLFSFHGLPERQLTKINSQCLKGNCCDQLTEHNQNCYKAQCFATSRAIAKKIQLSEKQYSVCFQSRQGNIPWIQPYIDNVITDLANGGCRHLRVFSPSFVADCLETNIEIGYTYRKLFQESGGEELYLVPAVNSTDLWVAALENIIRKKILSV